MVASRIRLAVPLSAAAALLAGCGANSEPADDLAARACRLADPSAHAPGAAPEVLARYADAADLAARAAERDQRHAPLARALSDWTEVGRDIVAAVESAPTSVTRTAQLRERADAADDRRAAACRRVAARAG